VPKTNPKIDSSPGKVCNRERILKKQWELSRIRRERQIQRKIAEQAFKKQKRRNVLAQPGQHDFIVVLDHMKPSFNVGKIFRSADAFGARELDLIGIDFFDPSPAVGSFKWVPAKFYPDFDSCHQRLVAHDYSLFALIPYEGKWLSEVELPRRSAFIFGHEEFGISFQLDGYPHITPLRIPQFGKVESLNVSVAASIVMYEYVRQNNNGKQTNLTKPTTRH
jgi:tRNA G18 (ribose-2'-O)-methylase SpoU